MINNVEIHQKLGRTYPLREKIQRENTKLVSFHLETRYKDVVGGGDDEEDVSALDNTEKNESEPFPNCLIICVCIGMHDQSPLLFSFSLSSQLSGTFYR